MTDARTFEVAGTFACNFCINGIKGLMENNIELKFDPENPHDKNAVVVLFNNQKIGFVPKLKNKFINPNTSFISDWKIVVTEGKIKIIVETEYLHDEEEDEKTRYYKEYMKNKQEQELARAARKKPIPSSRRERKKISAFSSDDEDFGPGPAALRD
jgi:hypothetical protein